MGGGVVCLHRSLGLRVPHFCKGLPHWHSLAGIDEHCSDFGLARGGHDVSDDLGDGVDCAVVGRELLIVRHEKVAAGSAPCLLFAEVGGIAVDRHDHVAGVERNNGIVLTCGVVQKLVDFIHC